MMTPGHYQIDHKTSEVVLCTACQGEGTETGNPQRRGDEEEQIVPCHRCGGAGRLRMRCLVEYERIQ